MVSSKNCQWHQNEPGKHLVKGSSWHLMITLIWEVGGTSFVYSCRGKFSFKSAHLKRWDLRLASVESLISFVLRGPLLSLLVLYIFKVTVLMLCFFCWLIQEHLRWKMLVWHFLCLYTSEKKRRLSSSLYAHKAICNFRFLENATFWKYWNYFKACPLSIQFLLSDHFQCWYKCNSFTGENLEPAVFIK